MKFKNKLNMEELVQKIEDAPVEEKSQAITEVIQEYVNTKYEDVVKEYQEDFLNFQSEKDNIDKFGLRHLNKEEVQFYDMLAKQEITVGVKGNEDVLLPVTTLNYVFEDLRKEHPLFQYIDFAPAGLQRWFISETSGKATWGKVVSKISEELEAKVEDLHVGVHKLSAFIYIPEGILDLGHSWIDRFVREILYEAFAEGLEEGILVGDGNESPIGLNRDLDGPVEKGVYTEKTPIAITDFGVDSFNEKVLPTLTREGDRRIGKIIVVANPIDLKTSVYRATHTVGVNGYNKATLPLEFDFIPSRHIERGKAIAFLEKGYVAGLEKAEVDTSFHYKFLDHLVTYRIVGYANGRPKSNDDSVVLDITGLQPLLPEVKTVQEIQGA